ncbi:MAG: hypothetical protein R3B48_29500 [Kofleriaceae bacterium]
MLRHSPLLLGWTSALTALGLSGCAQLLGFDETSVAVDPLACAQDLVSSSLEPTPINTEAGGDAYAPSCGSSGALDQAIGFTAPITDYYVFDTFGASFDTVLAIYDQCSGQELVCNDNAGAVPQSELVRKFEEGQKALVVIEGNAGDTGTGNLRVSRVTCPDADLEGRTFPVELNTVSFGDDFGGACGGQGKEDRAYHWVAPKDGLFAFRADATTFAPTVTVRSGPRCSDESLGCNAAAGGIGHAEVVRRLKGGQPVTLEIDGVDGAGEVTVHIEERTATCPEGAYPSSGVTAAQLTPRVLAPSCGAVEVTGGVAGSRYELGDRSYSFTMAPVEAGCAATCNFELTAMEPMYLYVLDGDDCSGPELTCRMSTQAGGTYKATVPVQAAVGVPKKYTIVVADTYGQDGTMGRFDLNTSCSAICFAPPTTKPGAP